MLFSSPVGVVQERPVLKGGRLRAAAFIVHLLCLLMLAGLSGAAFAQQTCQSRSFSAYEERVLSAYIAYYGRPADTGGLSYWQGQLAGAGGNLDAIIDAFGNSPEYQQRFGSMSSRELIRNLYQQLYGRDPDEAGWFFYEFWLDSGVSSLASIAMGIHDGTEGEDIAVLENRKAVARHFVTRMEALGANAPNITDGNLLADAISNTRGDAASRERACMSLDDLIGGGGQDVPTLRMSTNGQEATGSVTGLSDGQDSYKYFKVVVPDGVRNLRIGTQGEGGDPDLYVKRGSKPTLSLNDCFSDNIGTREDCLFETPFPGEYYILVHGYSAYVNLGLTVSWEGSGSGVPPEIHITNIMDPIDILSGSNVKIHHPALGEEALNRSDFLSNGLTTPDTNSVSEVRGNNNELIAYGLIESGSNRIDVSPTSTATVLVLDQISASTIDSLGYEKLKSILAAIPEFDSLISQIQTRFSTGKALNRDEQLNYLIADVLLELTAKLVEESSGQTQLMMSAMAEPQTNESEWYKQEKTLHTGRQLELVNSEDVFPFSKVPFIRVGVSSTQYDREGKIVLSGRNGIDKYVDDSAVALNKLDDYQYEILEPNPLSGLFNSFIFSPTSRIDESLRQSGLLETQAAFWKWFATDSYESLVKCDEGWAWNCKKDPFSSKSYWTLNGSGNRERMCFAQFDPITFISGGYMFSQDLAVQLGTQDPALLDAIYKSAYTNIFLLLSDVLGLASNLTPDYSKESAAIDENVKGLLVDIATSHEPDYAAVRALIQKVLVLGYQIRKVTEQIHRDEGVIEYKTVELAASDVVQQFAILVSHMSQSVFRKNNFAYRVAIITTGDPLKYIETIQGLREWQLRWDTVARFELSRKPYPPPLKAAMFLSAVQEKIAVLGKVYGWARINDLTQKSLKDKSPAHIANCFMVQETATGKALVRSTVSLEGSIKIPKETSGLSIRIGEGSNETRGFFGPMRIDSSDSNAWTVNYFFPDVPPGRYNLDFFGHHHNDLEWTGVHSFSDYGYLTRYLYDFTPLVSGPRNVKATSGHEKIRLSWDPVAGAENYTVFYHTDPGIDLNGSNIFLRSKVVLENSFEGAFPNGVTYYFVVTATLNSGLTIFGRDETKPSKEVSAAAGANDFDILYPPHLSVLEQGNAFVRLEWTQVSGASSYEVYVSTSPGIDPSVSGTYFRKISQPASLGTTMAVADLQNGERYYFAVRAVTVSAQSAISNVVWGVPSTSVDNGQVSGQCKPLSYFDNHFDGTVNGTIDKFVREGVTVVMAGDVLTGEIVMLDNCQSCVEINYHFTKKYTDYPRSYCFDKGLAVSGPRFGYLIGNWDGFPSHYIHNYSLVSSGFYVSQSLRYFKDGLDEEFSSHSSLHQIRTIDGNLPNAPFTEPQLTADAQRALFLSRATNLVRGVQNGARHLYSVDLATGLIRRLSETAWGEPADGDTVDYDFATEAGKLVFRTQASNLENGPGLYLVDLETGLREALVTGLWFDKTDPQAERPALDAQAGLLAWDQVDASGQRQIHTLELASRATRQETPLDAFTQDACCVRISSDGRYLAWQERGQDGEVWLRVIDDATGRHATVEWPEGVDTDAQSVRIGFADEGRSLHWLSRGEETVGAEAETGAQAAETPDAPLHIEANPVFAPATSLH